MAAAVVALYRARRRPRAVGFDIPTPAHADTARPIR